MPLTKIQSLGITDGTIVNADINASAGIVGTKLSGVNDAKAWVNFNGTGTVAIRGSFNVSSITDNGAGDYTVNFTTALTDANYCCVALGSQSDAASTLYGFNILTSFAPTASAIRILFQTDDGSNQDSEYSNVAIFR